jgi:hypothetical protein
MTNSALVLALATEFDHLPPTLIESTVRAAARRPGDQDLTVEDIARADVAALAEAMRRSGSGASR